MPGDKPRHPDSCGKFVVAVAPLQGANRLFSGPRAHTLGFNHSALRAWYRGVQKSRARNWRYRPVNPTLRPTLVSEHACIARGRPLGPKGWNVRAQGVSPRLVPSYNRALKGCNKMIEVV